MPPAAGVAAVAALLAAGCMGPVRGPVEVHIGRVEEDGRSLVLGVASCRGDPTVIVVDEAPDSVTVAVEAMTPSPLVGSDGCEDQVEVGLAEPLGGRQVIDQVTGRVVIFRGQS